MFGCPQLTRRNPFADFNTLLFCLFAATYTDFVPEVEVRRFGDRLLGTYGVALRQRLYSTVDCRQPSRVQQQHRSPVRCTRPILPSPFTTLSPWMALSSLTSILLDLAALHVYLALFAAPHYIHCSSQSLATQSRCNSRWLPHGQSRTVDPSERSKSRLLTWSRPHYCC